MADFGANVLSSSVALLGLLVIMGLIYTIWSQINMKKNAKKCGLITLIEDYYGFTAKK